MQLFLWKKTINITARGKNSANLSRSIENRHWVFEMVPTSTVTCMWVSRTDPETDLSTTICKPHQGLSRHALIVTKRTLTTKTRTRGNTPCRMSTPDSITKDLEEMSHL